MSPEMPMVPAGNGKHPITLVVISANRFAESAAFYSGVFGWQAHSVSPELTAVVAPAGPMVSLRSNVPAGFPAVVPFIVVHKVEAVLAQVVASGGQREHEPWVVPLAGTLARFKDPSGTVYGLIEPAMPGNIPHMPMPFGSNPKPAAGAICSLEMYAVDGNDAARFFGGLFGWGTLATMPQYMAFDPGAGVPGVFQSHTPVTPALAYIYATDVAAKIREIETAGGKRMGDPMPVPGMGCFGYFADPSGTAMGLIGP